MQSVKMFRRVSTTVGAFAGLISVSNIHSQYHTSQGKTLQDCKYIYKNNTQSFWHKSQFDDDDFDTKDYQSYIFE